jgi:hypothetical protein
MKISKWLTAMLVATITFVSCNKDNDSNENKSIEGRWVGTYVNDASTDTFYYRLNLKSNGDLEELNSSGAVVGSGQWQLNENTNVFMSAYQSTGGQDFSLIAAFDKEAGKLIGNWGYDNSNTDGGTFDLEKE